MMDIICLYSGVLHIQYMLTDQQSHSITFKLKSVFHTSVNDTQHFSEKSSIFYNF